VAATAGRGGGGAVTAGRGGGARGEAVRRRRRAGRLELAAVRAAAWQAGRREEVKGEKERRKPVGRLNYILCRVPAIRHSAKIF
jgi:hypothetical protein